ncbi:MAG: multiheme c-type cytochrome [Gemmataceae bacterium]
MDSPPNPPVAIRRVVKSKPPYIPAIQPWLRPLLWLTFAGFAILGATGVYLSGVTLLNWMRPQALYTTPFTFWMFLAHGGVGLIGVLPYLVFGLAHYFTSRNRENRKAVSLGLWVFGLGIVVILTGLALFQFEGLPQLPTGTLTRSVVYWLHILVPLLCIAAYIGHRKAGPAIQWGYGKIWGVAVGISLVVMVSLHGYDPRAAARLESKEGIKYFEPSEARTGDGKFIPAEVLMNDKYCMNCHADVYKDHLHSSHKFSSFNNPAYLFSVKETREMGMKRDGNVKASRWCAGCHDPVPFFSGKFDDPNFDFENHETGHAGVTCVVCHSITDVHGPRGNASFTIEEQQQYPFTYTDNAFLKWINNQMVKAKPEFHKKTMLRPLHKTSEFCSTCHKVALPVVVNHYKDFLRGQDHYSSFIFSGMGHGSRSFYFPDQAKENCASCHMPLQPSNDFGSKDFDGTGERKMHNHRFPGANIGLFAMLKDEPKYASMKAGFDETIKMHEEYLKDKKLRIDLFATKSFKPDGTVDDESLTVLRPKLPTLKPGQTYLIETVVRTLGVGHNFSQGTVDSNEIWVDFTAKCGDRIIGRNGATQNPDDSGAVDEWSHFINVLMLDRNGNRIDRRNAQDIFTPLYDHQIPPGAANVVHYRLAVPADAKGEVELTVRLRYRKFDQKYMELVYNPLKRPIPKLPIVTICSDTVTLPLEGGKAVKEQTSPIDPAWQRWNDYGIACYLEGGAGNKKGNLKQADKAFQSLLATGVAGAQWHGHINRARVLIDLAQLQDAAKEIDAAGACDPPAPWWLRAWLSGVVSSENATRKEDLDAAIKEFSKIVDPNNQPRERKMNFTKDVVVLSRMGQTLFKRALMEADGSDSQRELLNRSIDAYEKSLVVDPEDVMTHFGLNQCYSLIGASALAASSANPSPETVTVSSFTEGLKALSSTSGQARAAKAMELAEVTTLLGRMSPNASSPRLKPLLEARTTISGLYRAETDASVKAALAYVLSTVHRELHALLKPDELARSRTTQKYRESHPAANAAAEAIIIYPTDHPNAKLK